MGKQRVGQIKASQIRNSPDYPVQNLYPCGQGPEGYVFWLLNNLKLTEGIICRTDGWVSFAPAMVARMRIKTFRVMTFIDAWEIGTKYRLRLLYADKTGEVFEQRSKELLAEERDQFCFDIPLEHVDREGWFTCSLWLDLLTPLEDIGELATAIADGIENPCQPIIVRGTFLEIKG